MNEWMDVCLVGFVLLRLTLFLLLSHLINREFHSISFSMLDSAFVRSYTHFTHSRLQANPTIKESKATWCAGGVYAFAVKCSAMHTYRIIELNSRCFESESESESETENGNNEKRPISITFDCNGMLQRTYCTPHLCCFASKQVKCAIWMRWNIIFNLLFYAEDLIAKFEKQRNKNGGKV